MCGRAKTVEDDESMNLQKFKGAVCFGPVEIIKSQGGAHTNLKLDAQIFNVAKQSNGGLFDILKLHNISFLIL